ncbi:amidohydrolase, partial [Lysobacter sp. 2RAB21]
MRMLRYVLPVLLFSASTAAPAAPVTVLTAARIHPMDPAQPRAEAMAYDDGGKILAVGGKQELLRRYPRAQRLDVGAATVV